MLDKDIEKILNHAFITANQERFEFFTTEHMLLALCENDPQTSEALVTLGANIRQLNNNLIDFLHRSCPKLSDDSENTIPTAAFHRVIERAIAQRKNAGKEIAGGLHIIIAIMEEIESHAVYYLQKQEINKFDLIQYLSQHHSEVIQTIEEDEESSSPLTTYCQNLNQLAIEGKIDPLIGRQDELERTIQVLSRRRKNNPILVGEAGVGKTAIAEGLAKKIIDGEVPDVLRNTLIYAVDLGSMVAGSKYRGDFEKRIKSLIKVLVDMDDVIIFIDEIHTLLGAGSTSDSTLDASNLLKPALSSGDLRCIGATTYKEYKASFEKNAALARRFQKVDIIAPNTDESYQILKGLQSRFEKFHHVKYTDNAIKSAVELSDKYINDRHLPDKAIDLIDEAGAKAKIQSPPKKRVNDKDIEAVLAKIARIPERSLSRNDKASLKSLETNLKKLVFGQNEAISALTTAIKLSRAGLKDLEKPIGSFLFAGPTGVGKTEVSKQLANELGVKFLRFDMSEYMESHTISKLIGSPPGYVGFDQGGLLTDVIDNTPHCVLLLDEIEKAHPNIFNLLLQIMDYGKLTDSNGKSINFGNVILIMTSNAGAAALEKNNIGFSLPLNNKQADTQVALKRVFSPEFRNRLSNVIQFNPLPREAIIKVIDKLINELADKLIKQNIHISISNKAKNWLLNKGYNQYMGARPMARLIDNKIKQPLSEKILFGDLRTGGTVVIDLLEKSDKLSIKTMKKSLLKL